MTLTALAPWFGGARMNGKTIGAEIGRQAMVSIPFCGGCSELYHIDARQILLNDLHRHIITLAKTIVDDAEFPAMLENLEHVLVHPDCLAEARAVLATIEDGDAPLAANHVWAAAYFTNAWLTRSNSGSESEFTQPLATRRTSSGGSSVCRWRSAVEGLPAWRKILQHRCEFVCQDWRTFAKKVRDTRGHAVYVDPPWQDAGKEYRHKFTEQDHRDLARWLWTFRQTRVVIRHSDHPLYRDLYAEWDWVSIGGRNQGNKHISEMLIINGPSYTSGSVKE